ncbi:lysozyme c-1-like [Mya arenaria]|uniref:lysozyme c-1-like n=1 Tax=Mya arenaria TaxID=6604 RepID=UPI0022E1978C|nr:lysozyme c-1-like [Mya arenaria]XP_052763262.1 lysozyme c-1-like [Mya arenaria]
MMYSVAALLLCLPFLAHGYRYTKCGLADALRRENIPERELHKWVCMAEYESSFNTLATHVNRGGSSTDYGLFQINSLWNCDPKDGRRTRNGCGHPCSDFQNTDLSDDVACINKLRKWHRGWGFSYGYKAHCQDKTSAYLSECK